MLLSAYESRRSLKRNDMRSVRASGRSRQEGSFAARRLTALIALCYSTVILTSCGTSGFAPSPVGISGASPQRPNTHAPMTGSFFKLYTFKGGKDGRSPSAGLVALNGNLYGTTVRGGTGWKGSGCGVVFSLSLKSHAERVLHAFRGGKDGANPYAGLLVVNGSLYGATLGGGSYCDCGTVFELNPSSGQEKVVHRFSKGREGNKPSTNLVALDGKIYGSAGEGGSNRCTDGCGTIFQFDPGSQGLRVIHSFNGEDGANFAYLTAFNGKLYGATAFGGSGCSDGCGTIFSLSPSSGVETVLHSFRGGRDGEDPAAAPVIQGRVIYGTTLSGGDAYCSSSIRSCGTLYTFDLASHKETVVHRFNGYGGAGPAAALRAIGDEMYSTTSEEGSCSCYGGSFYGTIFSYVPKTNRFAVVYRLEEKVDGGEPESNLIAIQGKLYGTTPRGGGWIRYSF
jgi:uncharacterized repeat protein (TIGR03803 family)